MNSVTFKLTQYSHGAGCGCKLGPAILQNLLERLPEWKHHPRLIVGQQHCDDGAVLQLTDTHALIATTDFFLPIVDDPYDFGWIAATNAISDVYAMGGTPILALGLIGWPVDHLPIELASEVLRGAADLCAQLKVPLAGGHSIDNSEPVFGLAVNGWIPLEHLKTNGGAQPGDILFISKPIGIGIISTAQKQGKAESSDYHAAVQWMKKPNIQGAEVAPFTEVHAMTDVTGFGLLGHLLEMCKASRCAAEIVPARIPLLTPRIESYVAEKCVPGGTRRNLRSYARWVKGLSERWAPILADPQTSGGLLLSVASERAGALRQWWNQRWPHHPLFEIGKMLADPTPQVYIRE